MPVVTNSVLVNDVFLKPGMIFRIVDSNHFYMAINFHEDDFADFNPKAGTYAVNLSTGKAVKWSDHTTSFDIDFISQITLET